MGGDECLLSPAMHIPEGEQAQVWSLTASCMLQACNTAALISLQCRRFRDLTIFISSVENSVGILFWKNISSHMARAVLPSTEHFVSAAASATALCPG